MFKFVNWTTLKIKYMQNDELLKQVTERAQVWMAKVTMLRLAPK